MKAKWQLSLQLRCSTFFSDPIEQKNLHFEAKFRISKSKIVVTAKDIYYMYFLAYNKNIRFDFKDEFKVGDVRYDNMI